MKTDISAPKGPLETSFYLKRFELKAMWQNFRHGAGTWDRMLEVMRVNIQSLQRASCVSIYQELLRPSHRLSQS